MQYQMDHNRIRRRNGIISPVLITVLIESGVFLSWPYHDCH